MSWSRVYSHHPDGTVNAGSKADLANAVRHGASVKIGFPLSKDGDVQVLLADLAQVEGEDITAQATKMHFGSFLNPEPGLFAYRVCTDGKVQRRLIKDDGTVRNAEYRTATLWYAEG